MNCRIALVLIVIIAAILAYMYMGEVRKFPVTEYVCGRGYIDCFPVAKHNTRDSCEYSTKMSGWRCDSSDKKNIICSEPSDSFATSYCE